MKKLIFFSYTLFLLLFTVFSYAFVDPNLSYLKNLYSDFAFSNRLLTTNFYICSIVIFFIYYGIYIYLGIKKRISLREIFWLLGITTVILLFSYPAMLSYDIFNYIATSKVSFFYHENPYIVMPIEFTGDPLLAFMHAPNKLALYGPSWILLTAIPYLFGFGNFVITLINFKIFVAIFYFFTVFLIWKMSRSIISVILFAFNPLIVIETLVSGHNDIVMMCFALLAIILVQKKKYLMTILFLLLSILIKYSTVFLIPVFIYMLYIKMKEKSLNMDKIYSISTISMGIIFLLSPLREEIYPWYAIWFLTFTCLLQSKLVFVITSTLSFGLLLRYLPYMYLGTYDFPTPLLRIVFTTVPVVVGLLCYRYKIKKN